MKKTTLFICAALVVLAGTLWMPPAAQTSGGQTEDVRALLQAVSKNIGADNLNTLEYSGAGMVAAPGQGFDPIPVLIGIPESWPRFAVSNYTMTIDYTTMSSREAYTRTSPEPQKPYPALDGPAAQHGNLSDPSFRRGGGGIANPAPVQVDLRNSKNIGWDVVNTHYHWDHSGGLRGLVAAGAQIVTHQRNAEYYGRGMFGRERKLMPDSLSQREELLGVFTNPQYVQVGNQGFIHDRRPLSTDISKVMEFFNVGTGSPPYSNHNEFFLVAYLPAEGILINADLYSPPAEGAALPSPAPEGVVALGHIIKEYNLKVTQHVPIHGQPGSHEQFLKILGGTEVPDAHGPLVAPTTTTSSR